MQKLRRQVSLFVYCLMSIASLFVRSFFGTCGSVLCSAISLKCDAFACAFITTTAHSTLFHSPVICKVDIPSSQPRSAGFGFIVSGFVQLLWVKGDENRRIPRTRVGKLVQHGSLSKNRIYSSNIQSCSSVPPTRHTRLTMTSVRSDINNRNNKNGAIHKSIPSIEEEEDENITKTTQFTRLSSHRTFARQASLLTSN